MKFFMVVPYYLSWHYSRGFAEWARNIFNFIEFEFHLFSVQDLLKTLFAPFQRLKERYGGNPMDIEAILSVLLINFIMRVVGLVVRGVILIVAAIVLAISIVLAIVLIVLWAILPVLLLTLIIGSTVAYFKYKP